MKIDAAQIEVELGGRVVLDRATVVVESGEMAVLVGPNGSGKTTLLRTIYRYLRPRGGAVLVGGEDVWALSVRRAG